MVTLGWMIRPALTAHLDQDPRVANLKTRSRVDNTPMNRQIFKRIAQADPVGRRLGKRDFPHHPWSQEDHRANHERRTARHVGNTMHVQLEHVYISLDQGIRNRWKGPGGHPLKATVVPLRPRTH